LVAEVAGDGELAAQEFARAADSACSELGLDDDFAILWPLAVEGSLAVERLTEAERLLHLVADAPAGLVTPLAHAHLVRLRALTGLARGADDTAIDADLEQATEEFRDFGARFYLARTLLERADRAAGVGEPEVEAQLRAEAEAIFEDLRANRWLARSRRAGSLHE
jgi:hypothetical protein